MLSVVLVTQDQLAHLDIDETVRLLRTEVGELPDNDVDQDVDVVGVEELVAGVVEEHVHDDLVHRVVGVGGVAYGVKGAYKIILCNHCPYTRAIEV